MSMQARISTDGVAQLIKLYGTVATTKMSRRMTIEPKESDILDIDPAQLPKFLSATIIRLCAGGSPNPYSLD